MKKLLTLLMVMLTMFSLCSCKKKEETPAVFDPAAKSEGVMTYSEYAAAELGSDVLIEGFVQGAQSYWQGAKFYVADPDGAYFVYCDGKGEDINISEEDYARIVSSTDYKDGWKGICDGTKVQVKGVKSEFVGATPEELGCYTNPQSRFLKILPHGPANAYIMDRYIPFK